MKYIFTEAGQKMFDGYNLVSNSVGRWNLAAVNSTAGYVLILAEGPTDIKALMDLGIVKTE